MIQRFWYEEARQGFWVTSIFILCIVTLFELAGLLTSLRWIGSRVMNPFLRLSGQVVYTLELPYHVASESYHAYQRIQDLELRYDEVAAQVGEVELLRAENAELRQLTGATGSAHAFTEVAEPIISYGIPTIEKSKNDQLSESQMVLIHQTLVGVINRISDDQAEVQLLTQKSGQPFLAQTDSGVTGVIAGDGQHVLLTQLPVQSEVQVGQLVFTIGEKGVAPHVFIGRVQSIQRSAGDPTQTAILDQGASFYESSVVEVRE